MDHSCNGMGGVIMTTINGITKRVPYRNAVTFKINDSEQNRDCSQGDDQEPLLQTRFNFNPSLDK